MPYDDLYEKHGNRVGIDPAYIKRVAQIENSERAVGCTGSYCGIMQLSQSEFTRWGGSGSRDDPEQSIMAAANKMANEKLQFNQKYGRDPTYNEQYMMHQQGVDGLDKHMANLDAPAWQNMYSTGEGQQKGAAWSKRAIRLNTPGGVGQYGGVENITSRQFLESWDSKFKGSLSSDQHESAGLPQQAEEQHEEAGLPEGVSTSDEPEGKPQRAGRGAADAKKPTILNEEEEEFVPPKPQFQVPDLTVKFAQ